MRYTHDCDNCIALEEFGKFDLYACVRRGKIDTVVARFGSSGPSYSSGLELAQAYLRGCIEDSKACEALDQALKLAQFKGYR